MDLIDATDLKDTTDTNDTTKNGFCYWHHTGTEDLRAFWLNDSTDVLYLFRTETVIFLKKFFFKL